MLDELGSSAHARGHARARRGNDVSTEHRRAACGRAPGSGSERGKRATAAAKRAKWRATMAQEARTPSGPASAIPGFLSFAALFFSSSGVARACLEARGSRTRRRVSAEARRCPRRKAGAVPRMKRPREARTAERPRAGELVRAATTALFISLLAAARTRVRNPRLRKVAKRQKACGKPRGRGAPAYKARAGSENDRHSRTAAARESARIQGA